MKILARRPLQILFALAVGVVAVYAPGAAAAPWHPPDVPQKFSANQPRKHAVRLLEAATPGPGTLLLGVTAGADPERVARDLRPYATRIRSIEQLGVVVAQVTNRAAFAERARRLAGVAFVERSEPLRPTGWTHADADPYTGLTFGWAADAVRADEALPFASRTRVPVGIVDTGVDASHPDLAGVVVDSWDTVLNQPAPYDYIGHGTAVAGLVSALDNGLGARGVAPGTPLIVANTEDGEGAFAPAAVAYGIVWAVDAGAKVINLSLGGPVMSETVTRAVDYAYYRGALVVAAAGNDGPGTVHYPAATVGGYHGQFSIGLSVGATAPDGRTAVFSSTNDYVSVAAPGAGPGTTCTDGAAYGGVYTTIPMAPSILFAGSTCGEFAPYQTGFDGPYAYVEGTSFAAPIASAVAALVIGTRAPGALDPDQVATIVKRSARGYGFWEPGIGWGIVDARRAVELAEMFDTGDPTFDRAETRRTGPRRARLRFVAYDDHLTGELPARGGLRYSVDVKPAGGQWRTVVRNARRLGNRVIALPSPAATLVEVRVCDGNWNCTWHTKRLPRYR